VVKCKIQYRHPEYQILSSILTENVHDKILLRLASVINETFPTYVKNRSSVLAHQSLITPGHIQC